MRFDLHTALQALAGFVGWLPRCPLLRLVAGYHVAVDFGWQLPRTRIPARFTLLPVSVTFVVPTAADATLLLLVTLILPATLHLPVIFWLVTAFGPLTVHGQHGPTLDVWLPVYGWIWLPFSSRVAPHVTTRTTFVGLLRLRYGFGYLQPHVVYYDYTPHAVWLRLRPTLRYGSHIY